MSNKNIIGACHADELHYLFYGQLFGFSPKANSPEYRLCRLMSKMWCNFAKTGYVNKLLSNNLILKRKTVLFINVQFDIVFRNPNSPDLSITWNSTSVNNPNYLSLDGDNTCMVDGLISSSRKIFWDNILEIIQLKQKL